MGQQHFPIEQKREEQERQRRKEAKQRRRNCMHAAQPAQDASCNSDLHPEAADPFVLFKNEHGDVVGVGVYSDGDCVQARQIVVSNGRYAVHTGVTGTVTHIRVPDTLTRSSKVVRVDWNSSDAPQPEWMQLGDLWWSPRRGFIRPDSE